jgi:1,4-alpha-glucan branching enzyme
VELTDGTDTDYLGPAGVSDGPPASGWEMNFSTLIHAPLGATKTSDGGAVFKVWAPGPATASVAGQFNGWSTGTLPMTKTGGTFIRKVAAPVNNGHMYKYVFTPSSPTWKPDARARGLNPSDNYNAHIYDMNTFGWGDEAFQTPAFEDLILYELHVGTFSGRNDGGTHQPGTYRDVVDLHLNHLVELGINAVELTPITEFPWDWSGGYNPVSAYAPEWKYGSPDDLKYMIDRLHQSGIAVVLDMVWNHFDASDNYLWQYDATQIYFDTPHVDTPWGAQADFDRAEVRDYFVDSAAYWLEEFHMDGFRMDATRYMRDNFIFTGGQSSGWSLMQRYNDLMNNRYVDKISIAEELPNEPAITNPTSSGGAGFDTQWHDNFVDTLRAAIFAMAGGNPNLSQMAFVAKGGAFQSNTTKVVNYFESHDEAWPESGGQRAVVTIDTTAPHDDVFAKGRIKLANGMVMFSAGIPMFLQGSEFLESTGFGSNAPSTPEARLDWTKPVTYAPILQYFKDIIRLRKTNGGLRSNAACDTYHVNDGAGNEVLAMHRFDLSGNDLVIVANFSNNNHTNYVLGFPQGGVWYEILNSQASVYDGNGWGNGGSVTTTVTPAHGFQHSASITIPQMGLLLFRYNDPPDAFGNGDFEPDGDTDLADFAVFQDCFDGGACGADADLDLDGDVDLADYTVFTSNLNGPQ